MSKFIFKIAYDSSALKDIPKVQDVSKIPQMPPQNQIHQFQPAAAPVQKQPTAKTNFSPVPSEAEDKKQMDQGLAQVTNQANVQAQQTKDKIDSQTIPGTRQRSFGDNVRSVAVRAGNIISPNVGIAVQNFTGSKPIQQSSNVAQTTVDLNKARSIFGQAYRNSLSKGKPLSSMEALGTGAMMQLYKDYSPQQWQQIWGQVKVDFTNPQELGNAIIGLRDTAAKYKQQLQGASNSGSMNNAIQGFCMHLKTQMKALKPQQQAELAYKLTPILKNTKGLQNFKLDQPTKQIVTQMKNQMAATAFQNPSTWSTWIGSFFKSMGWDSMGRFTKQNPGMFWTLAILGLIGVPLMLASSNRGNYQPQAVPNMQSYDIFPRWATDRTTRYING